MPEIKIRYKNARTLRALRGIAKYFDFELEEGTISKRKATVIPITYAKKADFKALAGIWKDKDIALGELRKKAWGDKP